jgi:predicted PurR-regulated permease PerM
VGSFFFLAGLCVFGFQVYTWFNVGHWFDMDLLWLVDWLLSTQAIDLSSSTLVNWFHTPQEWLGFHQSLILVLDLIPLSLFLVVMGVFLFAFVYQGEKERSRIIAAVESEMRARVGDKYTSN